MEGEEGIPHTLGSVAIIIPVNTTYGKLFDKPPTPEKSIGSGWDTYNVPKDEKVDSSPEHPPGYKDLTATSPQPETSAGEGKSDRGKDIAPTTNLPTFDVDLLEIIEAENANDVAQSLLRILQFRVVGELGEEQVSTLERKMRTQRWKVGDGHSVEFPKPLRIIPKSDVEVFVDVLTS
ncbi:hypothetical protein ACFX2B_000259 [Malus domestica]